VHHLVAAYLDYQPSPQAGAPITAEQEHQLASLMHGMPTVSGPAFALDTSAWDANQHQQKEPNHG
jgi:hypothetical protein